MKDLKEFYSEVVSDEELKKEFLAAVEDGKIEDFLKAHDCDAGLEDVKAFLENQGEEMKPLSVEEMDNVAGGTCNDRTEKEVFLSIITVGTFCAVAAAVSYDNEGVGQDSEEQGRLCKNLDYEP